MSDCILWSRGKSMGYGITWRNGRVLRAHQAAWLDAGLEVPEGHQLHHICEQKLCINVDHLRLLSIGEHTRIHATGRKRTVPRPLKTHCKYGHEYTEENTYLTRTRGRRCRRCHADDEIRRRAEKRDRWPEDEWTYEEMYALYMGGA